MNVSYRWLRDCAGAALGSPEELGERLAARGFPVEEMRDLAEGLGDVVVGQVREVRPHPNADRLRVCEVDGGSGVVQVVCGAPNVEAGGWYPFAPVGAALPGGARIGKVKLRGEASEGMLCSEKELGLGRGEEGLMALTGPFTPGEPLLGALGLDDVRLDVEVTANRPDLLSHVGVARESRVDGAGASALPEIPGAAPGHRSALEALETAADAREAEGDGVSIRIDADDLCSRYLGLVIRGVRVGPSPIWLQTRLRSVGARPINNVVDATNYVLHELGQPLHAFDLDRLAGRRVVVRRAAKGERIETLDGIDRSLTPEMLAICDAERPIAVAGVMGGADSEVGDDTVDVLLECALFEPKSIRSTRKALGLTTEASYRFERGVDPEGMRQAILRAAEVVLATAGGTVAGPLVDVCPRPFSRPRIPLRLSRIERLLGVPFEGDRVRDLLEPLGFALATAPEGFLVEVPGFRSYDVTREVDLVEEIARTHGYDAFPDSLRPFRPGSVPDHPLFDLERRVRDVLAASGFLEAQTPAFAPADEGEVEILNPISSEEAFLRRSLLPGLQRRLEYNLNRGNRDVRLFEIGTVFRRGSSGEPPAEETHVAVIVHGHRLPPHWSEAAAPFDVWDLKGVLEALAAVASQGAWAVRSEGDEPDADEPFEPGVAFRVSDEEGEARGIGGRIRRDRMDLPPWADAVWGIELSLPSSPEPAPVPTFEPLPSQPGADRDLALLVPEDVPVSRVLATIKDRGGEYLREVDVFDVYRGEGLPPGVRSVAVRVRFQARERTLKDEEVDDAVQRITRALQEELNVGLRGKRD